MREIVHENRIPDHYLLNCDITQFDNQHMMSPLSPIAILDETQQANRHKFYCGGPSVDEGTQSNFHLAGGTTSALNEGADTTALMTGAIMMSTANHNYPGGYSSTYQCM